MASAYLVAAWPGLVACDVAACQHQQRSGQQQDASTHNSLDGSSSSSTHAGVLKTVVYLELQRIGGSQHQEPHWTASSLLSMLTKKRSGCASAVLWPAANMQPPPHLVVLHTSLELQLPEALHCLAGGE